MDPPHYDDIEIDIFFESEDDDDDVGAPAVASSRVGVAAVDPSEPPTQQQVFDDLERLSRALQQQPYRTDSSRGLRSLRAGDTHSDGNTVHHEQWRMLTAARAELDPFVQRDAVR
jgi:hypothetical protein